MEFSELEITAIENMLPSMGAFVGEKNIGSIAFNDLSKEQVLGLFAATLRAFRAELDTLADEVPW